VLQALHAVDGLSLIETSEQTDILEQQLANAVVATDLSPNTASITVADIRLAIQTQFGNQALPLTISKFRSDFVVSFASQHERDLVALAEILQGQHFHMLLLPWSNRYGGRIVDWDTAVTIDITGFPTHAFHPSALGPLLSHHCSIQTHRFISSKGICRVDAYALSKSSIPQSGTVGLQYQKSDGVRNVVFPVTMKTYLYSEAPEIEEETPAYLTDDAASLDTGTIHMQHLFVFYHLHFLSNCCDVFASTDNILYTS
jgi:hypothetical protein